MKNLKKSKTIKFCILLIWLSVVLAIISIFPVFSTELETNKIIDDAFKLTQSETLRYGLGSFGGGEVVSVYVQKNPVFPLNFSILTYDKAYYSNSLAEDINYSFTADTKYYEASFFSSSSELIEINFEVSVQKNKIVFPYTSINFPAKVLFLSSVVLVFLKILPNYIRFNPENTTIKNKMFSLSRRRKRLLILLILLSLSFWFLAIIINDNSHGSFENWYTDHARHPYSSSLFAKFGLSIYNMPLGDLASDDASFYKFVTWPQMPHLYPVGSILLFFPFALLLQNGLNRILVLKMEIIVLLLFSHVGLFFFLERFWNKKMFIFLKLLGIYAIYIPLIVYSANGMFDGVPFLFSLIALDMFLTKKYDFFLFFISISSIFKYQPVIFLFPLVITAFLKLFYKRSFNLVIKNRVVITAFILFAVTAFTALLNAPFLLESNNISVMNGLNAFNLNSQIPWTLQSIAVLSTSTITLLFSLYFLDKNPILTLSSIFMLIPSFFLTYFQIWYIPVFFLYTLIPEQKRYIETTLVWVLFIIVMLSFGAISFNPRNVLDGWIQVLGL
jgi:hypothetical protein